MSTRGFVCVLVGRRMVSSREAMHSVISFKPLGMESGSRTASFFLVTRGIWSRIAAHETIIQAEKG